MNTIRLGDGSVATRAAGRCRSVLLGLSFFAFAHSAAAQLTIGGFGAFPIPLETDANVAVSELSRMLPNAGVKQETKYLGDLRWKTTRTVSLFAVTAQGLSTRTWDTDARDWTDWHHLGNPSGVPLQRVSNSGDSPGIDFGLPLLSGWDPAFPDWLAYQAQALPSAGFLPDFETALFELDAPAGTIAHAADSANVTTATGPTVPTGWSYFNPQAGLASRVIATGKAQRHVFGTGMPRNVVTSGRFRAQPELPLIELRQELRGAPPLWIDHGRPGDAIGVTVGPGSTTSVIHDYLNVEDPLDHEEQHYVFVATDPLEEGDSGVNGPEVAYLRGDGKQFGWHSLGAPGGNLSGAPVATTYYTDIPIVGGKGRVVVFAVHRRNGDWTLSTQWHDGNGWASGWTDWGGPSELGGEKFRMTSAVVWHNGSSRQMANLRISAFGYSEPTDSQPGGLVEFHWNGSGWSFRPMRFSPDGHSLRTDHAVVVDEGTRDRVIAFARTYEGRILEDVQQFENGWRTFFGWNDLSTEPIVLRRTGWLGGP